MHGWQADGTECWKKVSAPLHIPYGFLCIELEWPMSVLMEFGLRELQRSLNGFEVRISSTKKKQTKKHNTQQQKRQDQDRTAT